MQAAFVLATDVGPNGVPPHWTPSPRFGYGEDVPAVGLVIREINAGGAPTWLVERYVAQFERTTYRELDRFAWAETWTDLAEDHASYVVWLDAIVLETPELEFLPAHGHHLTDADHDAITRIIDLGQTWLASDDGQEWAEWQANWRREAQGRASGNVDE